MNGRERLLKTLHGEKADRMPIAPFLYYNAIYEMFDYKPDMDNFFNPDDFDPIVKFVEYCDYFGFDVLHTLGTVWDMYAADTSIDHSVIRAWDNWDVTVSDERKGDERRRTILIRTPDGDLKHIETFTRTSKFLCVSAPQEQFIKTVKDFEIFRKYSPPFDFMDCSLVRRARQATGDKGLVSTCTNGDFNTLARSFRNLETVFMDPISDEGFYREMMDYFTENVIQRNRKLIANGADVIEVAANLAGSGVGPKFYAKYISQYENRVLKGIHQAGALNIFHNCGDAAKIMHLYNDMEIDCWGYVTPPPFGDNDIDEVLRVIRPNMTLRGNIDQVEFLMKASPAEVKARTRELVEKVKPRGNWILSTTDFFFDGTPYENIKAFADTGREFGQY
jgi:uroporphyrinogen decarboxylase